METAFYTGKESGGLERSTVLSTVKGIGGDVSSM